MKTQLTSVLVCLLFALAPARAETKASQATIDELLKLMNMDQTMGVMMKQIDAVMSQTMQKALEGKNLPPEAIEKSKQMTAKMMVSFKEELSPEKMREMFVSIYSDVFTEEEVRSIIDFYKTPAGQALISKQPLVMQKSMAFMQQRMAAVIPRIQAAAEEAAKELESGASPKAK
ncbi:MAG: uncharacterized protein QOE70_281 [Chthoniobacter sp.]|jgi:hypothetical protein|nr:uncharacterized protein [Chthoniobacter sp.]